MTITIRKAEDKDLANILEVESKSTPGLRYLGEVFEEFKGDNYGEFGVAEMNGKVVGVGKFTLLPDGSAWLESLRVPSEYQGSGIGKKFYERFFELAEAKGINAMRMYTNIGNSASKGLAERFGFKLAGTFRGMGLAMPGNIAPYDGPAFIPLSDASRGAELLFDQRESSQGFVIMNRTFYEVTPALGAAWTKEGKLYEEPETGTFIAVGARFMPQQALHIAALAGDVMAGLSFAHTIALKRGVAKLQYMFPPEHTDTQATLEKLGFVADSYDCIVMERKI